MGVEIVRVVVGGKAFTSWTRVNIRASKSEAARAFTLEIAAEGGAMATARTFVAGTKVKIYANGDLVLDGFVDRYQPKLTARDATITIGGRSKSGDAVDSSAVHKTGEIKGKKLDEIGTELGKDLGIKFTTTEKFDPIPVFRIVQGETVFAAIERAAKDHGVTLMGTADGNIELAKAGSKRQSGGLFEGVNIKEISGDHNWSGRHSKYIVKGQKPAGAGVDDLEIETTVNDAGLGRNRPIVIVQQEDTTREKSKKRGKNHRDRAAGNALKASVVVQGWRDEGGTLWTPNFLVYLESAFANIAQMMLVEGVNFELDASGGSVTRLELVDPKAHGGKTKGKSKSGKEWKTDDSEAE